MPYSSATRFAELPLRIRAAISEASPTLESNFAIWIHQPIHALRDQSVVQALSMDFEQGEREILCLCSAIKSRS
jgi:hypothetical protein